MPGGIRGVLKSGTFVMPALKDLKAAFRAADRLVTECLEETYQEDARSGRNPPHWLEPEYRVADGLPLPPDGFPGLPRRCPRGMPQGGRGAPRAPSKAANNLRGIRPLRGRGAISDPRHLGAVEPGVAEVQHLTQGPAARRGLTADFNFIRYYLA